MSAAPTTSVDYASKPDAGIRPPARSGLPIPFLVCAMVLAGGSVFVSLGKSQGWLRISKAAAPLKRSLDTLPNHLGGYQLTLMPRLPAETEQELGTRDYASWRVEDTSAGPNNPWRFATLSVTYYTGKPDQVPHVPEECLFQGGREPVGSPESCPMAIENVETSEPTAVRAVVFRNQQDASGVRVFYTIRCNSSFYEDRNQVRFRMTSRSEKYLYYSKVELTYFLPNVEDSSKRLAESAQRVFDKLLPVLVKDYWPDWEKLEREAAGGTPTGAG